MRSQQSLIKLIDKYSYYMLDDYNKLKMSGNQESIITEMINHKAKKYAENLITNKMNELGLVAVQIGNEHLKVSKEIFDLQVQSQDVDSQLRVQERLLFFKGLLIESAITEKREQQKKKDYSMVEYILDRPILSASTPNNKKISEYVENSKTGSLTVKRNGFREIEYRNKNNYFLTPFDAKVLVGLCKMWELKGEKIGFDCTFSELQDVLQGRKDGGAYNNLATSLDNLFQTTIVVNEYLDDDDQLPDTAYHNPISDAKISRKDLTVSIRFSDIMHRALTQGNVIKMSLSLFNDLGGQTSKLLYMHLVNLDKKGKRVIVLNELYEHIGLSGNRAIKNFNSVKDALEELKAYGVLKYYEFDSIIEDKSSTFTFELEEWAANKQPEIAI